jgi:hypothetical protein
MRRLFTVLGVAGVGKSRLVRELVGELAGQALVARGRCLPYGEGITFWPLLEAVKGAVELEDGDSPEESCAKLARALDVFGLGALLYFILTGSPPVGSNRFYVMAGLSTANAAIGGDTAHVPASNQSYYGNIGGIIVGIDDFNSPDNLLTPVTGTLVEANNGDGSGVILGNAAHQNTTTQHTTTTFAVATGARRLSPSEVGQDGI